MVKVLITGGAGFIGSHLADHLLGKGDKVVVVDDFSTGKKENLKNAMQDANFKVVEGDIKDRELMERLVKDCDIIYHMAAAVGVRLVVDKPLDSLKTNVEGTEIVLELASEYDKMIIVASSSEVYGRNYDVPLKETDDRVLGNTHITRWNYSCAKALDEFFALAYHKEKNLRVCVVRFFNVVGPRQSSRYGMVIPTFVNQALNNKPITVYGDGKQTRTFCYIKDIVEILSELGKNQKAIGQVFNLGSSEEISIFELAEKIKSLTNSESEIVLVPYEDVFDGNFEDTRKRAPDISKLKSLTGLGPKIGLDDALKRIIDNLNR